MNQILNIIITFIKGIKWTYLKVSVLVNIALVILVLFLYTGNNIPEPEIIIKDRIVEVPGQDGIMDTTFVPTPYAVSNPVNTELLTKYNSLKDSVAKLELFKDVIQEREYNEVYEDDTQKISIYTKIQGKLLKQVPTYEINPYTIQIRDTTNVNYNIPTNKILAGIEIGIPIEIFKPVVKGTFYFQNKKDNMISIAFDSNKTGWAGYIIKF